jgi:hypothetical protein
MGITPIVNLTPLPAGRAIPSVLEPLPMARTESTARSNDESYTPSNQQSAAGSDNGEADLELAEDAAAEDEFEILASADEDEPAAESSEVSADGQINFFA